MFRFLAKSALVTLVFKRYRRPIVSTVVLFLSYFLISTIHSDYVNYAVTSDDRQFLWLSFLLKWALLLGTTLIYYFYNTAGLRSREGELSLPDDVSTPMPPKRQPGVADPFAHIRNKEKLESRGDKLLNKERPR